MATVATPPQRPYVPPRTARRRAWVPNLILSLLLVLLLGGIGAGIGLAAITRDLPPIDVLNDPNSLGFKTAQIFDRKGQLLWEINDPSGGKRTVVSIKDMAPE